MSNDPAVPTIPYARQWIDEGDREAVRHVLAADFITQGPEIERFEAAVAAYCGSRYAVAVANATAALHIGAMALEVGPGDEVWTSPNTFVASANCALYCGGRPDFVDLNPQSYNLDVAALEQKLEAGRRPKVLVPVHFAGQPCDMAPIAELCGRHGIRIVEDASHAIGAEYRGRKIGDGTYSDLTVFSFHPVKILTTGEGGMLLTNDRALYERLRRLRSHGITKAPAEMTSSPEGAWYYEQIELGFNYRLTDLQAALGRSQTAKLPRFLERRRQIAARYDEELRDLPLTLPWQHAETRSAWHLYVVRIPDAGGRRRRNEVFAQLREAKIQCQVHYIPVHTQPWYRRLGFKPGDFPAAEAYYREALSLPMYAALRDDEQTRVIMALRHALEQKA